MSEQVTEQPVQANPEEASLMQLFHKADLCVRQALPLKKLTISEHLKQLRAGLIYAINIYAGPFQQGWEMMQDDLLKSLASTAVAHVTTELTDIQLAQLNHKTLSIVNTVGMVMTNRAPFARNVKDVQEGMNTNYKEWVGVDRPLTKEDIQRYWLLTFFRSSGVIELSEPTDQYPLASRMKVLMDMCQGSPMLAFNEHLTLDDLLTSEHDSIATRKARNLLYLINEVIDEIDMPAPVEDDTGFSDSEADQLLSYIQSAEETWATDQASTTKLRDQILFIIKADTSPAAMG